MSPIRLFSSILFIVLIVLLNNVDQSFGQKGVHSKTTTSTTTTRVPHNVDKRAADEKKDEKNDAKSSVAEEIRKIEKIIKDKKEEMKGKTKKPSN